MLAVLALLSSWAVHELPRFHESVFVGSVSSYDRTVGNDDGFSVGRGAVGNYSRPRFPIDDR